MRARDKAGRSEPSQPESVDACVKVPQLSIPQQSSQRKRKTALYLPGCRSFQPPQKFSCNNDKVLHYMNRIREIQSEPPKGFEQDVIDDADADGQGDVQEGDSSEVLGGMCRAWR